MDLSAPCLPHQSATFEERGVSVPFTTPTLAGARVRQDLRHGLVLVVPNPSGGRGVYVLPWPGVRDMCHPTLHDNMLHDYVTVGSNGQATPASVRAAARRVAMDGAAGRAAHAAAVDAIRIESASREATTRFLLYALAARTAMQADLAEVTALAAVVDEVGVGPHAPQASVPMRLAQLISPRDELAAWAQMGADETGYVTMTCNMADLSIRCTEHVLAAARAQVADPGSLIGAWRTSPETVASVAARPAWVLDGWELPCLLWGAASGVAARRGALAEIGQMLAVLPLEAGLWIGASIDVEVGQAVRRMVGLNQDWRSGLTMVDLVARNERFRAQAA